MHTDAQVPKFTQLPNPDLVQGRTGGFDRLDFFPSILLILTLLWFKEFNRPCLHSWWTMRIDYFLKMKTRREDLTILVKSVRFSYPSLNEDKSEHRGNI